MKKNKYDEKFPRLLNSIVCAIDILGFSEMILDSCKNGLGNNLLGEINYLIEKIKSVLFRTNIVKEKSRYLRTIWLLHTQSIMMGKQS